MNFSSEHLESVCQPRKHKDKYQFLSTIQIQTMFSFLSMVRASDSASLKIHTNPDHPGSTDAADHCILF